MTPIKEIWVILDVVFALDYTDHLNFMAGCGDPDNAHAVGVALGLAHSKEVYSFKPALRRMVPVGGSSA